ncbi:MULTISPECIES: SpaN/EivJ family type III secretion system needle length determinant [Pseudomonas]|jgi:hypothetical protein|uniref:SpaN/EivJ family type III secretion system needle length determinant n=1 Tax=Pseudomonas TaxID=286 RepID=UPI00099BE6D0|nr:MULTISPECIES: hypothetical protein [Pseudomonas]MCK3838853.1 hypothetical protein [Pseudomonas sp. NCIMB 10586]OPA97804.1 hypothetical protein BFW89_27510 [Pseudomonas synxantha]VCU67878.1 Hypothetical new protein [Pseudomonas synxantha]
MNIIKPVVGAAFSAQATLSGDKPGEKIKPSIPLDCVELDELPQGASGLLAQLQLLREPELKFSLAPLGEGKKVEAKTAAERTVEVGQVPAQSAVPVLASTLQPLRPIRPMNEADAMPTSPQVAAVVRPAVKVGQTPPISVALGAGVGVKFSPQAKAESGMLRQSTDGGQVEAALRVLAATRPAVPGVFAKGHQAGQVPQVATSANTPPAQQVPPFAPTVMSPVADPASGANVTQLDIPEAAAIDTLQPLPAQPLSVADKTPRVVVASPPGGQPQVVADPQVKPEPRLDVRSQQYLQVPFSKGEAAGLITVTKASAENSQQLLLSPNNSGVVNHLSESLAQLNAPLWRLADQQHREQRNSPYPDDPDDSAEEGAQRVLPVECDSV